MKSADLEESLSLEMRISNLLHLNNYSQLCVLTDIPHVKCVIFCYNFREIARKHCESVKTFPDKVFELREQWEQFRLQAVKEVVNEMAAHD